MYDITYPMSANKAPLYFQGMYLKREDGGFKVNKGYYLDLGTYFNAFSIKKWRQYTTIEQLQIKLKLVGKFNIEYYGMNVDGEKVIFNENVDHSTEYTFNLVDIEVNFEFDMLGIRLNALDDNAIFYGGEYQGEFKTTRDVKLGLTICTFKREKYLLPNLERLKTLTTQNENINIMVIDNGQTLEEVDTPELKVLHNSNFGGAGGFTRGMIEQVNRKQNTHILLMDDDIVIELSAIERLYSIMTHLKTEHEDKFFGGAMLRLEQPTIQHANTEHWTGTWLESFGIDFDLSDKEYLCKNENAPQRVDVYNAWWFCCIPIDVINSIGYPLPIFIKFDDVEYSIRNRQDIMTMNGIGVWHMAFENKTNPVIDYFVDRNAFLINHFSQKSGRKYFLMMCLEIICRRIWTRDGNRMRTLELALKDLNQGLMGITSVKSDKKFASLRKYPFVKPLSRHIFKVIPSTLMLAMIHFIKYDYYDKELKDFREKNLTDQDFWRKFLSLID